ncbi:hypothetical protein TNCV_3917951 [Trichonephila clavipes]|nr:hypothetical protein TNCV_3917951 [Trichonephila clavipes]
MLVHPYSSETWPLLKIVLSTRGSDSLSTVNMGRVKTTGGYNLPLWIRRRPGEETESEELAVVVVAFVEGRMVLLEMAVEAVDGLGTCVFCVDVDITFRGQPLFRSGATGEVSMSLKGVKAEVW